MFLQISQNLQENTCVESLFKKTAGLKACFFTLKSDSNTGVFRWLEQNFKNFFFIGKFRTTVSAWFFFLPNETWYNNIATKFKRLIVPPITTWSKVLLTYNKQQVAEAIAWCCPVKKVFLNILQNSQKKTCVKVSLLINLQASDLQLY